MMKVIICEPARVGIPTSAVQGWVLRISGRLAPAASAASVTRHGFVWHQVLAQVRGGHDAIAGLMRESQLRGGRRSWVLGSRLEYGVSITDACIGWEETEELLREMAEVVRV